jgi:hypothetical protein
MKKAPNGRRYRQGRDLADKTTRRRIRRLGLNPESAGAARTCPVHAVLGRFCKPILILILPLLNVLHISVGVLYFLRFAAVKQNSPH